MIPGPAAHLLLLLSIAASSAAAAADATARIGAATVAFDRSRWQASVEPHGILFAPQDEAGRELDPVLLRIDAKDAPCGKLAEEAFGLGHYDLGSMEASRAQIAGIEAVRYAAHTGCRNATPRGAVICVKVEGTAYVLQAVQPACRGRNLFSGIDPLAEIADRMTFSKP